MTTGRKRRELVPRQTVSIYFLFEQIGVAEYFLYDPIAEYLKPSLQGYRLSDDGYVQIEPDATGWVVCEQLGIELSLDGIRLVMRDTLTQQVLMTAAEAEHAARLAAEAKLAELQSEVQRLRDELKKRDS